MQINKETRAFGDKLKAALLKHLYSLVTEEMFCKFGVAFGCTDCCHVLCPLLVIYCTIGILYQLI